MMDVAQINANYLCLWKQIKHLWSYCHRETITSGQTDIIYLISIITSAIYNKCGAVPCWCGLRRQCWDNIDLLIPSRRHPEAANLRHCRPPSWILSEVITYFMPKLLPSDCRIIGLLQVEDMQYGTAVLTLNLWKVKKWNWCRCSTINICDEFHDNRTFTVREITTSGVNERMNELTNQQTRLTDHDTC